MFNEQYKNDNERIIASEELISKTRAKMKAAVANEALSKRHFAFRGAVVLTTAAAVICICMFGNILPDFNNGVMPPTETAKSNNSFVLTAYAAEQQPDGTVKPQKQLEFAQTDIIYGEPSLSITSEYMVAMRESGEGEVTKLSIYKNIAFRCDGENIKSVTFSVDEGYFSRTENDYFIKNRGTSYTMDKQELADGNMIYWGIDITGAKQIVDSNNVISYVLDGRSIEMNNVNIRAVATFEDGEVQEKAVVYDTQKGTLVLSEK